MFLPLTVTLVSAPGLAVFLVARSSFFTWATAGIKPLNKRAINRIRFISDVVPFCREYTTRAATAPAGFTSETSLLNSPGLFLDFSWVTRISSVLDFLTRSRLIETLAARSDDKFRVADHPPIMPYLGSTMFFGRFPPTLCYLI